MKEHYYTYSTFVKSFYFFIFFNLIFSSVFSQGNSRVFNDSIKIILDKTNSIEEKLKLINDYSEKQYKNRPKNVIKYASLGIKLSEQLNDTTSLLTLLRYKSFSQLITGEMEGSLSNINRSLQLCVQIKDSVNLASGYSHLGFHYDMIGDVSKSKSYYNKSLEIAKVLTDYNNILGIKTNIATMYNRQGNYQKAIDIYDKLLALCKEYNLNSNTVSFNKAQTLVKLRKYSDALDIYFKLKASKEGKSSPLFRAEIDHNIAWILSRNKLNNEAIKHYNSVYKYFENDEGVFHFTSINESLGDLSLEVNNIDEAEIYLNKALELKKQTGVKRVGTIKENLGVLNLKRKNYSLAKEFFQAALKNNKEVNDFTRNAGVFNNLSKLYFILDSIDISIVYAQKAIEICKEYQLDDELSMSLKSLINAYQKKNDFTKIVSLQKSIDSINLKLKDPEQLFLISQKIVQQKYIQNKQIEEPEEIKESKNWLLILALGMIGLLAIFYFLKRVRRKAINNINDYTKSKYLSKEESSLIHEQLAKIMIENKPYLNEDLKLSDLANALSTTDKKLSSYLNESLSMSFYDYINKYRIKEFTEKINSNKDLKQFSIIGMASDCGFKSKSTFYRTFRKELGTSPSLFLKQIAS